MTIVVANVRCDTAEKLLASDVLWHVPDVACRQLHGIAAIGPQQTVAVLALGGAAVDDGYKVSGDDDSVLAFLFGVLGDEGLFYDSHWWMMGNGSWTMADRAG